MQSATDGFRPPDRRRRGLSRKQTAERLGVSERTVDRQIKSGAIRSVLVSPRRRLVPDDEIDRILAGEDA
jgi:excisionase family DNA binding protein